MVHWKKMRSLFILFLLVGTSFVLIHITNADATVYYVSPAGDDSYNGLYPTYQGDADGPFKTVWRSINATSAGDTVYYLAGNYSGMKLGSDASPITETGTSDAWIVHTSYGDGEVLWDGTGTTWSSTFQATVYFEETEYLRISNITINHSSSFGLTFYGANNNITIDNCTFYDTSRSAILFYGDGGDVSNIIFENNTVDTCWSNWSGATRSQETVTLLNCDNFIIRNNYLVYNGYDYIDIKSSCEEGLVYNNRINLSRNDDGNYHNGVYTDAGGSYCRNISYYNNIIWGGGVGFAIAGEVGGAMDNLSFYNNIYNGTLYGFCFPYEYENNAPIKNVAIINNIVDNANSGVNIHANNASTTNLTIRNNIFQTTNKDINLQTGDINLAYQHVDHNIFNGATSEYYGTYSINASPSFVNENTGNYHYNSSSPAINNGSSEYAPLFDLDLLSRPQGAGYDIGAYEYEILLPCIGLSSPENNSIVDTCGVDNFGVSLTCGTPANVTLILERNNSGVWSEIYNYTFNNQDYGFSTDVGLDAENTGWGGRWHANATNTNGTSTTGYWYFTAVDDDTPPEISSESPENGSIGVSTAPLLEITVTDDYAVGFNTSGDGMYINISENTTGDWVAIYSLWDAYHRCGNGTFSTYYVNATDDLTTYYWKVTAMDSGNNINESIYHFTTSGMLISDPFPVNESTEVSRPPANLSAFITGTDIDVFFYFVNMTPTADVWTLVDSWSGISDERVAYTTLSTFGTTYEFLWGNTTYTWSVNCTDGASWVNETYSFTTAEVSVGGHSLRMDVQKNDAVNINDCLSVYLWYSLSNPYNGYYDVNGNNAVNINDCLTIYLEYV